jgi:hypothetical protein
MRKERLHTFTLIVGSILAFAMAFSQFMPSGFSSTKKKAEIQQASDQPHDDTQSDISLPSFSLPAPVHVQVNLNPYCLFEFFFEENVDEEQTEEDLLHPDRFFETMFRVIISPNAP